MPLFLNPFLLYMFNSDHVGFLKMYCLSKRNSIWIAGCILLLTLSPLTDKAQLVDSRFYILPRNILMASSTRPFSHFPNAQANLRLPLIANENAYLSDVYSRFVSVRHQRILPLSSIFSVSIFLPVSIIFSFQFHAIPLFHSIYI